MNKRSKNFLWRVSSALLAALFLSQSLVFADITAAQEQDDSFLQTGSLSRILTSNNPDCYAVIETEGDTVRVRGKNTADPVYTVFIVNKTVTARISENIRLESDGGFSSEMTLAPSEDGYYLLYIGMTSNKAMTYRLKYNNGWSIPDNGLCEANAAKLERIIDTQPAAAAYYLSADADREEISQTLDKLKEIAEGVCGGENDDYKKAYLLNRWVAENIYYDHDAATNSVTLETVAVHNVLSTLRTTCAGFANTYSALLEVEGIRSVNLKGAAAAGQVTFETLTTGRENHEFTAFWYEKEKRWVYTDACWSGVGDYENGEFKNNTPYDKYFDITGEALALDHRIDKAEERHYLQALESVEDGAEETAPEVLDPYHYDETAAETTDVFEYFEDTEAADLSAAADRPDPKPIESGNIAPYIIIGLTGVLIIGAGIILAVNKRKK
ncbi:MAG: transglutaminase-like domain-containing protein [Firmicutes bacterium]|nr:transglutaminase-like domain-containing protein [[Eubacterium] siraeum]MCM1488846.1 transglutaminase-like domain-containing protein [Bacillota bacterium]